jgi:hypothetical protein
MDDYDQNKGLARIRRGTGGFRGHVSSLIIKVKRWFMRLSSSFEPAAIFDPLLWNTTTGHNMDLFSFPTFLFNYSIQLGTWYELDFKSRFWLIICFLNWFFIKKFPLISFLTVNKKTYFIVLFRRYLESSAGSIFCFYFQILKWLLRKQFQPIICHGIWRMHNSKWACCIS